MIDRESFERKTAADIEEIWLPLLKTNGEWDEQKIRAELSDLVFIFNQVAEVYDYISGGKLSKQTYYADVIKAEFDDAVNKAVEERLADEREAMGE